MAERGVGICTYNRAGRLGDHTVDHLQRRHGFPFKSPRALSDWGKQMGHYRGRHIPELL